MSLTRIKQWIAIVIVIVCIGAGFAGSYVLGLYNLHESQQSWCTALKIITAHPLQNKQFFNSLLTIERQYRCE